MALPFVFVNVASTVDGKLAPASRKFVSFGSARDQRFLLELRSTADAVMAGARTVDLMPVSLGPGGPRYRRRRLRNGLSEYNLRVIVSGAASLNPNAAIFEKRFSPIIVLTSQAAPADKVDRLRKRADFVHVSGRVGVDFRRALVWLQREFGVKRLLCEGGGEVNEGLIRAGLVDEIYQTVCPLIFGGRHAPTMVDGDGVQTVGKATRLQLKRLQQIGSELFLVYRVMRPLGRRAENCGETRPAKETTRTKESA
jgi:riboflavin-specific deaminase-like protein